MIADRRGATAGPRQRRMEGNPELQSLSVSTRFSHRSHRDIRAGPPPPNNGGGVRRRGASDSQSQLGDEFANYRAVIELQDAISYQLIIFVTLTGNYDHVIGARETKCYRNGSA